MQQPDHELVTTRKGSIWFFDGNIVIDASSTLFRVHRGVLAKNSDVFRDLFLVPQPTTVPSGEIEGCAVVQMHDSAEDWTYVLNAMYDGRYGLTLSTARLESSPRHLPGGTHHRLSQSSAWSRRFYD